MWRPLVLALACIGCAKSAPAVAAKPATPDAAAPAGRSRELGRLLHELSEPGGAFLSDNWVSNESSYLQVARELRGRAGGAYIGVGPEQNFSYIALTAPEIAFIVDIRRDNAIEHLFYKSLFEIASSRADFLALLLGHASSGAPNDDATIEQLVTWADASAVDEVAYRNTKSDIRTRIEAYFPLDAADGATLERIERLFHEKGLGLVFEMHENNLHRYPPLRLLLAEKSPDGDGGFLASETAFRFVQRMQREDRIVPVVGDFAGPHALRAIGDELRRRHLVVSTFYVSNVEQYVMADGNWKAWLENVHALPRDDRSAFIRCYLDQGRPHPKQMRGHRTTTVLQGFQRFDSHAYRSWFELASDSSIL